jgi:hypothetical protein
MLRRIELEVLATVDCGDTISELATKLDHSKSYFSHAVAELVGRVVGPGQCSANRLCTSHAAL